MPILKPNERTNRILSFIIRYKEKNDGNSPSLDEISIATHAAKSNVHDHIQMLVSMGKIEVEGKDSRSIRVIGGHWERPG